MNPNIAPAEDDVRNMLRALSEEVQASLALSRAAVTAVAGSSPANGASMEQALNQELDRARRLVRSPRTAGILQQVQRRLRQMPDDERRADALAWALIGAADALPDPVAPRAARG